MASPYYVQIPNLFQGQVDARREAQRDFQDQLSALYAGGDPNAGRVLAGQAPDKLTAIRTALESLPETELGQAKKRTDLLKKWHFIIGNTPDEATRALLWNQMLGQAQVAGMDISSMPQQYSREAYDGQAAELLSVEEVLASIKPTAQKQVLKTYVDQNGNEVAVYRDGSVEVLGKAGGSFRVTPGGLVFSGKSGEFIDPQTGEPSAGVPSVSPEQQAQDRAAALEVQKEREKAEAKAKVEAAQDVSVTKEKRASQSKQTLSDLSRMSQLARLGVYTGGAIDRFGNFMASSGFPFDQQKANRTAQILQLSTQLKFGAKPPGMGAMTDAEWKIIQDAIPDPRSAGNVQQLIAGISEAERRIRQWMDSSGEPAKDGGVRNPTNRGRAALGRGQ